MATWIWTNLVPAFIRTRLAGQHDLHKIIGNASWLSVEQVARMGISLLVIIWMARALGPAQFGIYNFVLAFVMLFTPLVKLGLDTIVVRDIVRDPSCTNETLGAGFLLKLIGSIVALLLSITTITLMRPGDSVMLWLVAITAIGLIFQSFDMIDLWFQSQVQSKYTVWVRFSSFIITTLARIALLQVHASLSAFIWVATLELLLFAVGLVIAYRTQGYDLRAWRVNTARTMGLLRESWPLLLSGIAILVYMKIDQIMLGQMVGDAEVGIYSTATRLSEMWYFIGMAVVPSVLPSIVEAKKVSEASYYQKLQLIFNIMSVLAVSIALFVTLLARPVVVLLFGQTYVAAGNVLAVHIWSLIFVFLGGIQSAWDVTEGMMVFFFERTLLGAIINLVLNLLLIPFYASTGAAIATLISYACAACLLNMLHKETRPIFYLQINSFCIWKYVALHRLLSKLRPR